MRGGTLFSGIGAPELGASEVDWRWCAEVDPFASAVLAARFPDVVNLGDVERIDADAIEPVRIVVFGSPCQSFSVAGERLGLDDHRGDLALIGLRLVRQIRPRWVVFENVLGLLSSDGGRDFGSILRLMGELGYGFAYRVLDAQYFGIPQRRRRVFVVGYLGDWRPAAAVLFERESLQGHPAPSRQAREEVARPIASCSEGGSGYRYDLEDVVSIPIQAVSKYKRRNGIEIGNVTVQGGSNQAVAFHQNQRAEITINGTVGALNSGGGKPGQGYPAVLESLVVRRLTPRECERLQGFPDDFTRIHYRGKPAADGPRYRVLGNAMAVPVIRWILRRVCEVDELLEHVECSFVPCST